MKREIFAIALTLSACGQSSDSVVAADSPSSAASKSACETFATTENLVATKTVRPLEAAISANEKLMIQTAVLLSVEEALTPDQAVDVFTDRENGGSLGGDISYFEVKAGRKTASIAKVTFFPGDNEYGALFRVWKYDNGQVSSSLIGTIGDSDIYCLAMIDHE
jgi:hypothetical protein